MFWKIFRRIDPIDPDFIQYDQIYLTRDQGLAIKYSVMHHINVMVVSTDSIPVPTGCIRGGPGIDLRSIGLKKVDFYTNRN